MPLAAPSEIETTRTRLRLISKSDLPALMPVNGDDEVTRFLPYATWRSLADAEAWYERIASLHASGSGLQFVLVEKESGEVVGTCLLFRFDENSSRAELGYALGRRRWGAGLMNEALQALIGHAFHVLGIRRLEAEVNPRNAASVRVLERLGFAREGLLRQRWVAAGGPYDVIAFGLLRDEYRPPPGSARGLDRTSGVMKLERLHSIDDRDWLLFRMELWPDCPRAQHLEEMARFLAEPGRFVQFIIRADDGRGLGFAEASIRTDHVNGTSSSPVAYLEGLYVRPDARKNGVARQLVQGVSEWALSHGCTEMAADTQSENLVSQATHRSLGFAETERAVFFCKSLITENEA